MAGIRLTTEQYTTFVREAGQGAKKVLDKMVATPKWKEMPDAMKINELNEQITFYRSLARTAIQLKDERIFRSGLESKYGLEPTQ